MFLKWWLLKMIITDNFLSAILSELYKQNYKLLYSLNHNIYKQYKKASPIRHEMDWEAPLMLLPPSILPRPSQGMERTANTFTVFAFCYHANVPTVGPPLTMWITLSLCVRIRMRKGPILWVGWPDPNAQRTLKGSFAALDWASTLTPWRSSLDALSLIWRKTSWMQGIGGDWAPAPW